MKRPQEALDGYAAHAGQRERIRTAVQKDSLRLGGVLAKCHQSAEVALANDVGVLDLDGAEVVWAIADEVDLDA